jgi:hypothetical protein
MSRRSAMKSIETITARLVKLETALTRARDLENDNRRLRTALAEALGQNRSGHQPQPINQR